MPIVDFSLIDDKGRIDKLDKLEKTYLETVRSRSEQLTKAKLGSDFSDPSTSWAERMKRLDLPDPEVDPMMDKRASMVREDLLSQMNEVRNEGRKQSSGLHASFKEGTLDRKYVSRSLPDYATRLKKLEPDVESLNKMIRKGKSGMKILKSILPFLKPVSMGLTALGAASYADQAGAAVDMATGPLGGVEEMGVSPEQKDLDIQYLNRIRQLNQRKK